jgi:hypothetical protein
MSKGSVLSVAAVQCGSEQNSEMISVRRNPSYAGSYVNKDIISACRTNSRQFKPYVGIPVTTVWKILWRKFDYNLTN